MKIAETVKEYWLGYLVRKEIKTNQSQFSDLLKNVISPALNEALHTDKLWSSKHHQIGDIKITVEAVHIDRGNNNEKLRAVLSVEKASSPRGQLCILSMPEHLAHHKKQAISWAQMPAGHNNKQSIQELFQSLFLLNNNIAGQCLLQTHRQCHSHSSG